MRVLLLDLIRDGLARHLNNGELLSFGRTLNEIHRLPVTEPRKERA